MTEKPFRGETIHFVTGRLAEPALREIVQQLAVECDFKASIQVLPITVAALMTPTWIAKYLQIPKPCHRIILPGYSAGDLTPLTSTIDVPIDIGPKDMRRLPEFFGETTVTSVDGYDIEIIAEINHAPRQKIDQIVAAANQLREQGANVIDIGCDPDRRWNDVGTAIRELVDQGHRVSIDSFDAHEVQSAVAAGAELVLSVNSDNRRAALDWDCEVVVIPDQDQPWFQVADTIEFLATRNVPLRVDPILEPIGLGFANSLNRYFEARKIWPDAAMMMGVGNLTELTDVDSAGVNMLLLAICQELNIDSVLTTQVINWARSSVAECDIARRILAASYRNGMPPKNLDHRLICLRDPSMVSFTKEQIQALASEIQDNNYRLMVGDEQIHLLGNESQLSNADAFELFAELMDSNPSNVDASHAFYLGYEMCKATIALQLGKQYEQDEALNWGYLTVPEANRRRLKRNRKS